MNADDIHSFDNDNFDNKTIPMEMHQEKNVLYMSL